MKRVLLLGNIVLALCAASSGYSQDAATEERLNRLSGLIQDLIESHKSQQKQIADLGKAIESLRAHADKPAVNYATVDDVKRLADKVGEVDRKRMDDAEKVRTELLNISKALTRPQPPAATGGSKKFGTAAETSVPQKGFEYVIQSGDTLSVIVQAYREKNIKVTAEQILKANPGLKADRMPVGKKIFIPAPADAKKADRE